MICPYCNAQVDPQAKTCPKCGAQFKTEAATPNRSMSGTGAAVMKDSGILFGAAARAARLNADYSGEKIIETRTYNLIMAGVVMWGLLVNAIICAFAGDLVSRIDPTVFIILYFALSIVGIIIAGKSKKPLISFLGYNMLVIPLGLMLSIVVADYLEYDPRVVFNAFLYTLLIVTAMSAAAIVFPGIFEKLGRVLLIALLATFVLGIVLMLLRVDMMIYDLVVAGIFSLYIGYDIYRSQQFAKTVDNAVDCALDIYLDIANLFIRLLSILGRSRKRD